MTLQLHPGGRRERWREGEREINDRKKERKKDKKIEREK